MRKTKTMLPRASKSFSKRTTTKTQRRMKILKNKQKVKKTPNSQKKKKSRKRKRKPNPMKGINFSNCFSKKTTTQSLKAG
jgi:hypothetical protein